MDKQIEGGKPRITSAPDKTRVTEREHFSLLHSLEVLASRCKEEGQLGWGAIVDRAHAYVSELAKRVTRLQAELDAHDKTTAGFWIAHDGSSAAGCDPDRRVEVQGPTTGDVIFSGLPWTICWGNTSRWRYAAEDHDGDPDVVGVHHLHTDGGDAKVYRL